MADIGDLHTTVTADANQFNRTMSQIESKVGAVTKTLKGLGVATLAIQGFRQFDAIVEKFDNIADGAKKAGVSVETFQKISYIAKYADADVNAVAKSMGVLTKSIYDASKGSESLEEGFRMLGLNAQSLMNMNPAEQLLTTVEALSDISDQNQQGIIARILFGNRRAEEILAVARSDMEGLREGFAGMNTLSEASITRMSDLSDQLKTLKESFSNLFGGIVVTLGPVLSLLMDAIAKLVSLQEIVPALIVGSNINTMKKNALQREMEAKSSSKVTAKIITDAENMLNYGREGAPINIDESMFEGIADSAFEASQRVSLFSDKLHEASEAADNMIDSWIESTKKSKTSSELERILGDKMKDPWEMTDADNKKNADTLSFFRDFFKGKLSDDEIKDQMSPYFTNKQRPDTTAFDRQIQEAFDLIQKNPIMNADKVYAALNSADSMAKSDGMRGVVEELRKMQDKKLGIDNVPKVVLQVLASPDFVVRMLSDSKNVKLMQDIAGNAVTDAAVSMGR